LPGSGAFYGPKNGSSPEKLQSSIAIVLPDNKRQIDPQLVIADLLRPAEFLIDGFGIKGFALP
jgi:hypothetical protein